MKLSAIKKNPANPRTIRGEQFERLKRSIAEFPQMMELRPIVTDAEGVVLGGNMRLEALKALGHKEVPDSWVKRADELTEEQKREFTVKDNAGFGDWDWDALANEWDELPLKDWGVDMPNLGAADKVDRLNASDEWVGMPEFEPGKEPYRIIIQFEDEEKREEFAKKYKMQFIKREARAWSTWYPFRGREDLESLRYE